MVIELLVNRESKTRNDDGTLGRFFWENLPLYHTCEPIQREVKIWGKTAISCGRYQILMQHSPKFGKDMPHLQDVPDYTGVMIHPLNWPSESEGCIGIGLEPSPDGILHSQAAFNNFLPKLESALLNGEVWLTIASAIPITL